MLIVQCAVIFGCLAAGEALVWATGIPVPGSIIGMLILTACLQTGLLKLRHVEGVADFLVRNLGFFFVPAGVALVDYFDVLREQWLAIVGSAVLSTWVVLAVTGHGHQLIRKYMSKRAEDGNDND